MDCDWSSESDEPISVEHISNTRPGRGNFLVKDLMTPPPLGVENVKIQENSKKTGDLRGSLMDPLQPFLGH